MVLKKSITTCVAILYGLLSLLLFSETFILQLLEAKKEYCLNLSQNVKEINFSKKNWEKIDNKTEFKFKNHYYDVKKITTNQNKVTVIVVQDDYENLIQYLTKHIYPKNKKSKPLKNKKNFYLCCSKTQFEKNATAIKKIQNNYPLPQLYSKQPVKKIFHPPCSMY